MSRSRRKYPAGGISKAASDKEGKSRSSRAWRRMVRIAVRLGIEPPHENEHREPWSWAKDGKRWYGREIADRFNLWRK